MIPSHTKSTETPAAYGLFPAGDFVVTTGGRAERARRHDCATNSTISTIPQALWFFRGEVIAVPRAGLPVAGFDPLKLSIDDLRAWSAVTPPGSAGDYPGLIWLGAPEVLRNARIDVGDDGCERLLTAEGPAEFIPAPRLASNRAFYNADSSAFLGRRVLHLRGEWTAGGRLPKRFVARCIWPEGYRLDAAAPLQPIAATPQSLREFVRSAPQGGAQSAFSTRLVWLHDPLSASRRAGRPLIALMLNGAQGDDDEAHGGHFGLVSGRVGAQGEMHDWLVANFYTLATESEKGIIAAMRPLEGYLGDVNSGQAWYRPSYMLVATLRDERTAAHLSTALARMFNQFYRNPSNYRHAADNCTGLSISTLRAIGWNVPKLGATSWLKAIAALPAVALSTGSMRRGKASFDYLTEDRTRLLPALAFEQAGADLLRIVSGKAKRELTPYEALLASDVDEILLVRIPQFPSSRVCGDFPVASVAEYQHRVPKDPAQQQIIPVDPRPFPAELKDPAAPKPKPSRSDYAVATYAVALLALGGWALHALLRRKGSPKSGTGARD